MKRTIILGFILTLFVGTVMAQSVNRPRLLLTEKGVAEIKSELKANNPLLKSSFEEMKALADAAVAAPIEIPEPLHVGGGASHEKHKSNYYDLYHAGTIYQITGDKKYADFVKKMLTQYADIYPALPVHPAAFTKTPGKIFYQVLNEAVWLNFVANAYDCIYSYLTVKERKHIEKNLFRPMVEFLENGLPDNVKAYNSMHNFGTWMTSAVGMIGYVMDDKTMVEKALKGSKKDGSTGFLLQLEKLFSPDGYYEEGPGYQRYAIFPFITFGEVINNNEPSRQVFKYRDGVLLKAVNTLIQTSYEGDIFRMNDAIDKNIHTFEIIYSTNIAYHANPTDTGILSIIKEQNKVTMTDGGVAAAKAIAAGKATKFDYRSMMISDGENGDKGGLGIIRNTKNNTCLTLKATSLGGGHGHFDRLSIIYFANGTPVMPDFGSARFINIDAKAKGGYAPENKSFAQQTIAHNALVVDSASNYRGVSSEALKSNPTVSFSDFSNSAFQIMSATETEAYKGVQMQRTLALLTDEAFDEPMVIDLVRAQSDAGHVYDLPFYYNGHFMSLNMPYKKIVRNIDVMGLAAGYQHLWKEGTFDIGDKMTQFCWLIGNQFYTLSTACNVPLNGYLIRTGADDPDYNLVNRGGILFRGKAQSIAFASVIEAHGDYNLVKETTHRPTTSVASVSLNFDNVDYTMLTIRTLADKVFTLIIANKNFDTEAIHSLEVSGQNYKWKGNYYLTKK